MTDAGKGWDAAPIIDWLLAEGRLLADPDALVGALGARMLDAGAPVWRLRLSMRTLHPLITAITAFWERDAAAPMHSEHRHGLEGRPTYIGSPLEIIGRTRSPFRKRLYEGLSEQDHTVLHELRARGATDYFGLPLLFSSGTGAIFVATTDREGGFSAADIDGITAIAAVLAPVAEIFRSRRLALALAEAYLGPRTGRQVLDGRITRGDIERIEAAILISDVRGWTRLNRDLPAEEALSRVNRYFETVGQAIDVHGGEILKLLGDGVLAIFPSDETRDGSTVCDRALDAAKMAFDLAADADPPLGVEFGVGLHFGEVFYGNVGSQTRIDFTVLGQAVNIAARIESLCGAREIPILYSQTFADLLTGPSRLVAEEHLKGLDGTVSILTVPDSEH